MWKKVENYALKFHHKPRHAAIHLYLADKSEALLDQLSVEEMCALGNLLRAEPHVWYNTLRGDLSAHSAPHYEEDLD